MSGEIVQEAKPIPETGFVETGQEIDLIDVFITCARAKRRILIGTVACALLGLAVSLLLPVKYTAKTVILPPQPSQPTATMLLGQLGSLTGAFGKDLSLRNPSDMFVSMLRSRTVEDAIVRRFDLMAVYGKKSTDDARLSLRDHVTVTTNERDGLISIAVEDRDKGRAAAMANGYVEELHDLNRSLAISEAGHRRLFFENEMQAEQQALAGAELALKRSQQQTGLIQLDAQAKAIIEAVAATRAQIAMREVQLRTMQAFATKRNPDFVRAQQELTGLRAQLTKLEHDSDRGEGNLQVPTSKVPEASLEYIRRVRDVKYHEAVFEFLAKQLEAAKIDEARDSFVVQVVDRAVPPARKSSPRRLLITAIAAAAGLLLSFAWTLAGYALHRMDTRDRQRLQRLRSSLDFRH